MRQFFKLPLVATTIAFVLGGCSPHTIEQVNQKKEPLILAQPAPYTELPEKVSTAGWGKAYRRRTVQLGMTLTDFVKMPVPDAQPSVPANEVYSNCKGSYKSFGFGTYLAGDISDSVPGVVMCTHLKDADGRTWPAQMRIGNEIGLDTIFYFIQPVGQTNYYLYKITSQQSDANFSQILHALTQGLGKKPSIQKQNLVNGFAAPYQNVIAVWDNGISRIEVRRYNHDLETSKLTYVLKPLEKIAEARKPENAPAKPNSI